MIENLKRLTCLIFPLLLFSAILGCGGDNETDEVEIFLQDIDPQVVLSPGMLCDPDPTKCLEGSTSL